MDKRVQFDFEIEFTNGGGLQGQEFGLDIDGNDITVSYIIRPSFRWFFFAQNNKKISAIHCECYTLMLTHNVLKKHESKSIFGNADTRIISF